MNSRSKFTPPVLTEYGALADIVQGGNDGVPPPYPQGWFDGTTQIRTAVCDGGAGPGKPDANPDAWNHCGSGS